MGWALAEEVAANRPVRPGPEWWTLLDLAQSARAETRRAWPGEDYLMRRANCSRATLYRRLDALESAGLIKIIRTGRGQRTRYEILPIPGSATATLAAGMVSQHGETPAGTSGVSESPSGVSKSADGVSPTVRRVPSLVPSDVPSKISNGALVSGSVESRARARDQDQNLAEWEEKQRQIEGLKALMLGWGHEHPEAS
jgi:hypothetical protein